MEHQLIRVGKQFTFESAHYIDGHPTCGQLHGHTWTLDVQLLGVLQPNGMVIDFKELGKIVKSITNLIDHKTLNHIVPVTPLTAETLVIWITEQLALSLSSRPDLHVEFVTCKLQEGPGGWAEYTQVVDGDE
jgi:6-pyruvoyltetrahydropterin/6-carboxytetrahydropterin synthase